MKQMVVTESVKVVETPRTMRSRSGVEISTSSILGSSIVATVTTDPSVVKEDVSYPYSVEIQGRIGKLIIPGSAGTDPLATLIESLQAVHAKIKETL